MHKTDLESGFVARFAAMIAVAAACSSGLRGGGAKADGDLLGSDVAALGAPVLVGSGAEDGFVTADDGILHVFVGDQYRSGKTPETLGPAQRFTELAPVNTIRATIDAKGDPHVVFTTGQTSRATRSYYVARKGGRWAPAEKFADAADFRDRKRAYVADVAVDDKGNVLVAFWVGRGKERREIYDDPSFYYRWRSADGRWSEPRFVPGYWSSTPKVEYQVGQGFYMLWQHRQTDWRIAGPVAVGADFREDHSVGTASGILSGVASNQNEGADFVVTQEGHVAVASNVRELFLGPVGVWASVNRGRGFASTYLGAFPGSRRGNESSVHPIVAFDRETDAVVLVVKSPGDERAYYAVNGPGARWLTPAPWAGHFRPLLADLPAPQGTGRQGPSVVDMPGPGVAVLVRDGGKRWYLRSVQVAPRPVRAPAKPHTPLTTDAWKRLGPVETLGQGVTPSACVDAEGAVHVVYANQGRILYRKAAAPRQKLSEPEDVPVPEGPVDYNSPHLVCASAGPHLTFERDDKGRSRKAWYTNRLGGTWKSPFLALHAGDKHRINYPRLTVGQNAAYVAGFIGGGSSVAKIVDFAQPRKEKTLDVPWWVAHPLLARQEAAREDALWLLGRDGPRGHKLQRIDGNLRPVGTALLMTPRTPTKTYEPTGAAIDEGDVVHATGVTGAGPQVLWYSSTRLLAEGRGVMLGPPVGSGVGEDVYPVLAVNMRNGNPWIAYRDFATGQGKLVVFEVAAGEFLGPITFAPTVTKRARWNPQIARVGESGLVVVWDSDGQVFMRGVGLETPGA